MQLSPVICRLSFLVTVFYEFTGVTRSTGIGDSQVHRAQALDAGIGMFCIRIRLNRRLCTTTGVTVLKCGCARRVIGVRKLVRP